MECYPSELNQVFMNMIINSCEAIRDRTDGRTDKGRLKLGCRRGEYNIEVTIQDNGCGMSETTKNRLFEPFYTTKDVGEGTGLGMSISYGIIKKHQGELIVESELGVGTLFTLSLPLKTEDIEDVEDVEITPQSNRLKE